MVDEQGRELATGSFGQEFWRSGQRFLQLTRPGEWCVADTTGRQRLPWQPIANELADFQPASGLAIVRRPFRVGSGHWVYSAVGPEGKLNTEEYSQLLFWGPEELLGERTHLRDSIPRPRYVVHDHQGRRLRTLDYYALAQYDGLDRAVLVGRSDLRASTLVINTRAGGVQHRLAGSWDVVPFDVINEDGRTVWWTEMSFALPAFRAKPFSGSWSGGFKVMKNRNTIGYLDADGHRSWED